MSGTDYYLLKLSDKISELNKRLEELEKRIKKLEKNTSIQRATL